MEQGNRGTKNGRKGGKLEWEEEEEEKRCEAERHEGKNRRKEESC